MTEESNISRVADAFFHLWQKQVSLLAQSPDKSYEFLLAEGQRIAAQMSADDEKNGGPVGDPDNIRPDTGTP